MKHKLNRPRNEGEPASFDEVKKKAEGAILARLFKWVPVNVVVSLTIVGVVIGGLLSIVPSDLKESVITSVERAYACYVTAAKAHWELVTFPQNLDGLRDQVLGRTDPFPADLTPQLQILLSEARKRPDYSPPDVRWLAYTRPLSRDMKKVELDSSVVDAVLVVYIVRDVQGVSLVPQATLGRLVAIPHELISNCDGKFVAFVRPLTKASLQQLKTLTDQRVFLAD